MSLAKIVKKSVLPFILGGAIAGSVAIGLYHNNVKYHTRQDHKNQIMK